MSATSILLERLATRKVSDYLANRLALDTHIQGLTDDEFFTELADVKVFDHFRYLMGVGIKGSKWHVMEKYISGLVKL